MNKQEFAYISCILMVLYWRVQALYITASFVSFLTFLKHDSIVMPTEEPTSIY